MYGKILGAMIGAAIGLAFSSGTLALVLALLGAWVGHRYDQLHDAAEPSVIPLSASAPVPTKAAIEAQAREQFARHLCALFVEVARADGELVRGEVRVVREFFAEDLRFTSDELEWVRESLQRAIASPKLVEDVARACRDKLLPSERLLLLNALYELARADGEVTKLEREAIKRAVGELGISEEEHRSITALHFGGGARHYAALGVSPEASDEEIKSAYRRLALLHHPDKVAHLGPGAVSVAARRFREINQAYEEIRKLRGQ
ncbi:MAG: TerB family tellurite resistance protein [Myxococcota bacterium]